MGADQTRASVRVSGLLGVRRLLRRRPGAKDGPGCSQRQRRACGPSSRFSREPSARSHPPETRRPASRLFENRFLPFWWEHAGLGAGTGAEPSFALHAQRLSHTVPRRLPALRAGRPQPGTCCGRGTLTRKAVSVSRLTGCSRSSGSPGSHQCP